MPATKRQSKTEKNNYSLAVDLISSIDNESMVDIMLIANDGVEIPASRFVLGARSPILQQMLFQGKRTPLELKLDYSTDVVHALVHYCRTNELFEQIWSNKDERSVRELVRLYDCAIFFELDGLQELISTMLGTLSESQPHLACPIYDESTKYGEPVDALKNSALQVIRLHPAAALLKKSEFGDFRGAGVSSLSSAVVEEIIGDPKMHAEEITMFKAVCAWVEAPHVGDGGDFFTLLHERRHFAKQMVSRCINLCNVAPTDLLGTVTDSGLVEDIEVSTALVNLALRVEREGFVVSKIRAQDLGDTTGKSKAQTKPASTGKLDSSIPAVVTDDMSVASMSTAEADRTCSSSVCPESPKKKKSRTAVVTPERPQQKLRQSSSKSQQPFSNDEQTNQPRLRNYRVTSIRQAIGLFLADKLDKICIHPDGNTVE